MTKALIFDFSDTLVNSTESRMKALQELVQQFLKLSGEKAKELMLSYWRMDLLNPLLSLEQILTKAVQEFCIRQDIACEIDMDLFCSMYRKKVREYECLRQSFVDIFPQLRKKYLLFILTIEPRKTVELLLEKPGIKPEEFDEIITGTDLKAWGISKMSICIYEQLCERHKLAPAECVMIGDSPLIDILPASTAGLQTVLFSPWTQKTATDLKVLLEDDFL